jgi:maltooligosyltrehalose synthase
MGITTDTRGGMRSLDTVGSVIRPSTRASQQEFHRDTSHHATRPPAIMHPRGSHGTAACDQLLREQARIAAVLADLPESWANVRKVLNERQAIVG